jgi:predicted nucleic acid-binding Zn ribbon protein
MKDRRKNRNGFVHISSVINKVFQTHRKDSDAELIQVWNLWDSIVGAAVAQNARPAVFKGKLLLVHVSSSSWIQQLQFLKKDIINKLNHALNKELVEEMKFKIGPLE